MRRAACAVALFAAAAPAQSYEGAGFKLGVSGFAQVDARLLDQSAEDELDPATQAPLNTERITVRRARVRLEAHRTIVGAALEIDANTTRGPALQLIAAEVNARWPTDDRDALPPVQAGIGLVRIPFGLETRELDVARPFLEQSSITRALFPGSFQLGLRAAGAWRMLRLEAAVMSGEPSGSARFAAQAPASALEVVGRAALLAPLGSAVSLEVGLSGLEGNGFHPGTPTTKDQLVWRDANGDGIVQLSELQVIPGTAAEPSATFRRFALGADARVIVQLDACTILLGGEAIWAQDLDRALYVADPIATGRPQRARGGSARLVVSELPFKLTAALRWDRYNPDADASDQQGGTRVPFDATVSTLAAALAVRIDTAFRLLVEYDWNHNAFGRDVSGAPASLAANALTTRAEVVF